MRFKTTENIFKDFSEYFDENWMDSNTVIVPPKKDWDYQRELAIEDVDIWEVIVENGNGVGLYASWSPYAEFYMLLTGWRNIPNNIETFYGAGSQKLVLKRATEIGIVVPRHTIWVEPEDMWLYQEPESTDSKIIIL